MLPLVRLPSLDLLRGFVAVARRMSVTQAADDLCLTQSAISKQIRTLEESLGYPLFRRGFRKLSLTEQGQMLFRVANASVSSLQECLALLGPPKRRAVTVTAGTGVAGLWLLPGMSEFQARFPYVDLRLIATNSVLELGTEVDLAIRYCSDRQAPLGALKLFDERIAPVASPSLRLGGINEIETLQKLTLLEFDWNGRPWLHWGEWLSAKGWTTSMARGIIHFNQYEQMIQAAVAGQGVALGRLELLRPMLKDRRLQAIHFGVEAPKSEFSYWLLGAEKNPDDDVQHVTSWILESAACVREEAEELSTR